MPLHAFNHAGRPPWKAKSREEAETFFLDALKKWQKEVGLKKMILVGHSLGGYLAASYALRYPDDIQHLVLVCPAGMVGTLKFDTLFPSKPILGSIVPMVCTEVILPLHTSKAPEILDWQLSLDTPRMPSIHCIA